MSDRAERLDERGAVPITVAGFTLIEELGRGGMGIVYLAQQQRPRRQVALKLIRTTIATPEGVRRFEHEAEILGQLQHAGIAQVYEAGTATVDGEEQPFIAMELVRGAPLTEHASQGHLDTRQRIELVVKVCEAVEYAHRRGVIHRDLKPGNILVDASGEPKVLDFGVARATNSDILATSLRTEMGQLLGTFAYMSPEQAQGDPRLADARSDVYSLGVILYELLAGRLPHDLRNRSIPEVVRIICEEETPPLSWVSNEFRGDLETIVTKALDRERDRRYVSAGELGADLRRFLRDEPIVAKPASTFYQLQKFAKRNKGLVTGVAATTLVLIAGLVATLFALRRAEAALKEERFERYRMSIAAAQGALVGSDNASAVRLLETAPAALRGWEWRYLMAASDTSLLELGGSPNEPASVVVHPGGTWLAGALPGGVLAVWSVLDGHEVVRLKEQGNRMPWVVFDPCGRMMTTNSEDSLTRLWALQNGHLVRTLEKHGSGERSASFSPDGRRLLTLSADGMVWVSDVRDGSVVLSRRVHEARLNSAVFNGDGTRILTASADKTARIWSAADGHPLHVLSGHAGEVARADFSEGGSRVMTLPAVGVGRDVRVWDANDGLLVRSFDGEHAVNDASISSDGEWVLIASEDGARIESVSGDRLVLPLRGHEGVIHLVAFSPDGTHVATASADRTVRIWDARNGAILNVIPCYPTESIKSAVFSPDGERLVTTSGGRARIWDVQALKAPAPLEGPRTNVNSGAFSPDGTLIVTAATDEVARIWDVATCSLRSARIKHEQEMWSAAFNTDSTRMVTTSDDGSAIVWDVQTGDLIFRLVPNENLASKEPWVNCASFSPDDRRVLTASGDESGNGSACVWDAATGNRIAPLTHPDNVRSAAFSPDGSRVATACDDGQLRLWDWTANAVLIQIPAHHAEVISVAFSSDGSLLVTASEDKTAKLWDAATGGHVRTFVGHEDKVMSAFLSPDGTRVVTASWDRTVRLWDPATGREVLVLRDSHPNNRVNCAIFSPDGTRLLITEQGGNALVYDSVPWRERFEELRAKGLR